MVFRAYLEPRRCVLVRVPKDEKAVIAMHLELVSWLANSLEQRLDFAASIRNRLDELGCQLFSDEIRFHSIERVLSAQKHLDHAEVEIH